MRQFDSYSFIDLFKKKQLIEWQFINSKNVIFSIELQIKLN